MCNLWTRVVLLKKEAVSAELTKAEGLNTDSLLKL